MLFSLDNLFQSAFEFTGPCCYGRNNGLSQPSISYQSCAYYLLPASHQLCELVRSGVGIIVPVSQLRSQRTRRVCECSEGIMKPELDPQTRSLVPFPAQLYHAAPAHVTRLPLHPAPGGPSSSAQSWTLGCRSPWPC